MFPTVIPQVIAQHAAEVPILLHMRGALLQSPQADLSDLCALDQQIAANLKGLSLAGQIGWDLAHERFEEDPDPSTIFALAYLANIGDRRARVPVLMAALGADHALTEGAALGLSWHGAENVRALAIRLLDGATPTHHALALACCLLVGHYPAQAVCDHLEGPPQVRVWALRLAGWGNISAAAPQVALPLSDDDDPCRLARAIAAAKLAAGTEFMATLQEFAADQGPAGAAARMMLGVALTADEALNWVAATDSAASPDQKIETAGYAGHPALVPWLLDCTQHDAFKDPAEVSIAQITGVQLSDRFEDDVPPAAANPFDTTAVATPKTYEEKVAAWWSQRRLQMADSAHINGQPVGQMDLAEALATASLCDRGLIALRARKTFGVVPAWQCHAPGFIQRG